MTTYQTGKTSARITCESCGQYLGMYEGYYDKCEDCRVILPLIQKIKDNLTPDLLTPQYRKEAVGLMDGHCYVATECFYYIYGKEHGWKPMCGCECNDDSKISTHWWLEKYGEILDITAEQFPDGYNYSIGRKQFFVSYPSKRCLTLVERIKK